MGWSDIPAFVADQLVDEDDFDIYLADNSSYLKTSIPSCAVNNTGGTISAGAGETTLTFANEEWDTDGIHGTANPERLTCVTDGKYRIYGYSNLASNGNVANNLRIYANGTALICDKDKPGMASLNQFTIATEYPLTAGDYVTMVMNNGGVGALDVTGARFGMRWLGNS